MNSLSDRGMATTIVRRFQLVARASCPCTPWCQRRQDAGKTQGRDGLATKPHNPRAFDESSLQHTISNQQ